MSIASFKTILRNTVYYEMKKKIVKNSLNCNFLTDFHTFKIQSQYNFNELSVFGQKKKKGFFSKLTAMSHWEYFLHLCIIMIIMSDNIRFINFLIFLVVVCYCCCCGFVRI